MSLLKFLDRSPLRAALSEITSPVRLRVVLSDEPPPEAWADLGSLASLSPLIHLERELNPLLETDQVQVSGNTDYGIRFRGLPMGNELAPLLSAVLVAGRRDSGLAPATRRVLQELAHPVHIQVFTTPT